MPRNRRNVSRAEKMAILREHLIERVPITEVREKHGFSPQLSRTVNASNSRPKSGWKGWVTRTC